MTVPASEIIAQLDEATLRRIVLDGGCRISPAQARFGLTCLAQDTSTKAAKKAANWTVAGVWVAGVGTLVAALAFIISISAESPSPKLVTPKASAFGSKFGPERVSSAWPDGRTEEKSQSPTASGRRG